MWHLSDQPLSLPVFKPQPASPISPYALYQQQILAFLRIMRHLDRPALGLRIGSGNTGTTEKRLDSGTVLTMTWFVKIEPALGEGVTLKPGVGSGTNA